MSDVVPAVQRFSIDLFTRVAETPGNVVVAPYSVATALAMAMAGAAGNTAEEFARVLHGDDAGALGRELSALVGDGSAFGAEVTLDLANSLWVQQGLSWKADFLAVLEKGFGARPRETDLAGAPDDAARAMNGWVAEQTRNKITDLISPEMLDALTRMLLINAAYFKAPWVNAFDPAEPGDFTTADGSTVQTPMMTQDLKRVDYRKAEDYQALALPFRGDRLAMALVLPEPGRDPQTLLDGLAGDGLGELLGGMRRVPKAHLELPRWKFRFRAGLTGALQALGLESAFDDRSDFSGMTEAEPLVISDVVHEAFIAVDEEGAEAAAATGVVMAARSAPMAKPPHLVFDRPFLFAIFDRESTLPLFIGRVDDPTQGER